MIKTRCIHPDLVGILAQAGHGARVLIADMNFPATTKAPQAEIIYLGWEPGKPNTTEILRIVLDMANIEAAHVMQPDDGTNLPHFAEFAAAVAPIELAALERFAFYDAAGDDDTCLVVVTGEQRPYGNILLTMGVV